MLNTGFVVALIMLVVDARYLLVSIGNYDNDSPASDQQRRRILPEEFSRLGI